ncbi:MAG: ORF6N domain-containing protein [Anaerostipes sp.]|uniref:ORF6N domain-containing protein n=1 Tax=Anaerostipes sp. TaxID=1872530 RepID=UPI0039925E95
MKQVKIRNTDISLKSYKDQKVVTFSDIDTAHCCTKGTTKRNFFNNKGKMVEDEDYFKISYDECRNIVDETDLLKLSGRRVVYLITLNGYLLLVRNLKDELLYPTQREFINKYFTAGNVRTDENNKEAEQSADKYIENMIRRMVDQMITPSFSNLSCRLDKLENELHITDGLDSYDEEGGAYIQEDENLKHVKVCGKTNNIFIDFMSGNYNIEETDISDEEKDVELMRELVQQLSNNLGDCSPSKSATYRKIYSAMDVDWEQRRNKYKKVNPWTSNKTKPSKLVMVKKDERLRKLFIETAQNMVAAC